MDLIILEPKLVKCFGRKAIEKINLEIPASGYVRNANEALKLIEEHGFQSKL